MDIETNIFFVGRNGYLIYISFAITKKYLRVGWHLRKGPL